MYSSFKGSLVTCSAIRKESNNPPARKMMIHPYSRMRELVQKGIISKSMVRFFHLGPSLAIKYPKG